MNETNSGKNNNKTTKIISTQKKTKISITASSQEQDRLAKEEQRKARHRLAQKRYRERVKAKAAKEGEEKRARRRLYNKTFQDKLKASAKAIQAEKAKIATNQHQREQTTTTITSKQQDIMASSSPMDLGSPPTSSQGGLPVVPVQLLSHTPNNSSSTHLVPTAAAPDGTPVVTNAGVTLSRDITSSITRMKSMMASSPIVKRMSETKNPTQEQVRAYEYGITAMKEQVEYHMELYEETFQERIKGIKTADQLRVERIKGIKTAEQLHVERQELRKAGFETVSDMKQSLALAMFDAAAPVKDTIDDRAANVSANVVICPTPDRETRDRNASNGENAIAQQPYATPPVFPSFAPSTPDSRFQLPTGNFCMGMGSDNKKHPAKPRLKPKTRTPIKSSMASRKNASLDRVLKSPNHR